MTRKPLARIADEQVSFSLASSWCRMSTSGRGYRHDCPSCDSEGAYKAYPDHGWCFSCQTYFTPVRLLAAVPTAVWAGRDLGELDDEDTARLALAKIGYVPLDWAAEWDRAGRQPELDIPALGDALRTWCAASVPDWGRVQLDPGPARLLARCLGLLPLVETPEDCEAWLAKCKQVMGRALGGIT
jgi:hypothetical protein